MENFLINIINKYGYFGVFFLIFLENIFPPIPSEVILGFSGFMTTKTNFNIISIIFFATIGSLIGAFLLYYIGFLLNKDKIIKIIESKYGKLLFLKKQDIDKASNWFNKIGTKAVFFCRFIPLVRSLISLPAGINKMKISIFFFYTLIGSLIWNSALVFLGALLKNNWQWILNFIHNYSLITIILFGLFCLLILFNKIKVLKK